MARRKSVAPEDALNSLGPRLRELREEAGMKANELAVQLQKNGWDIDPVVLSTIENKRRTLTDIEIGLILKVLGLSWKDLES
jgi:hypothetical protein